MKLTMNEIKTAMQDPEFRKSLPPVLRNDVQKYEKNPECGCNISVFRNLLRYGIAQLRSRFPEHELPNPDEDLTKLSENQWTIINCHIDQLETKLKLLPPGRKQVAVARWQDQITAIISEISA